MSAYYHQDYVRVPDGASIFYEVRNEGEPAMVLCDGLGCDGFAWKYLLPLLERRHRVVHWHYRGHGQSGMPADRTQVGISQCCDDLEQVLDAAGVKKAVLFGHSMGVQVALEFHRRHPERVAALVLVCGSYGTPLDTFHDTNLLKKALPFIRGVVERFPLATARFNRMVMNTELAVELAITLELNRALLKKNDFAPYFQHMSRMDPVVFLRTLQSLSQHTALDHLPNIEVPVLVVGGEQDHFTPAHLSRKMADLIPGATLLMVNGGSHTAPLESPEAIGHAVEVFLMNPKISEAALAEEAGTAQPSATPKRKRRSKSAANAQS